jgi:hypothetical protein
VLGLEEKIDRNVDALLDLIGTKYLSERHETRRFDLARKAQYFSLDTIGDIAFGKPFGFMRYDRDCYDYIRTTEENLGALAWLTLFPWLIRLCEMPAVRKYLPSATDTFGLGKIMGLVPVEGCLLPRNW